MRHLLPIILASGISVANAAADYSGIWQDQRGTYYSIHQSNDSIMVGEIHDNLVALSPLEQGSMYFTNNELDLAIGGSGYFVLVSDDGTYTYTRDGRFHLSSDNEIVNESGKRLLMDNQSTNPEPEPALDLGSISGIDAGNLSGCNSTSGCLPATEENGTINVANDGSITKRDAETGEVSGLGRVVLAWIPPLQITGFTGYPISVTDDSAVSFFHAGDEIQNDPLHRGASIYQGCLEKLSYNQKVWTGYFGEFNGNAARLNHISDSNGDSSAGEEIRFNSDSSATITFECQSDPLLCNASPELQDRQLSKIY